MAAKKAPAKKMAAPKKSGTGTGSANAAEKRVMDKKAKSRTDVSGRSGMGASKPRYKSAEGDFLLDNSLRLIATGKRFDSKTRQNKHNPLMRVAAVPFDLVPSAFADAGKVVYRGVSKVAGAVTPDKKKTTKKKK